MTFEHVFKNIVENFPNREFLIFYENGVRTVFTKDDYIRKTNAIAASLENLMSDVEKNTYVGLKVANTPFWFATLFALEKIGYKVVFLDNNYSKESIIAFQSQSSMSAIIVDKEEEYEGMKTISYSSFSGAVSGEPKNVSWESKIAFCTSGTTGNAKMYVFHADTVDYQSVNIGHYFLENERMVASRKNRSVPESYYLITQPFRHCLGYGLPLSFWRVGFPCVMPKEPGVFGIANACREDNIWIFISVPAVWKALLNIANKRYGDMSSESVHKLLGDTLTASASAGAILDELTASRLKALDIDIMNGWGMTETGFVTVGSISLNEALDYVGDYYNQHRALIKKADGTISESGYGELLINGRAMYDALIVNGEEIPRDPDEYFATGDIFDLEKDSFYFKGRCKSVIINENGENIYPEELDAYFADLSDHVSQFCTAEYNNLPCLYISVPNYETFDQSEVFNRLVDKNNLLPIGKRISRIITTSKSFPVTGKAETARFYVKEFVEQNKKDTKEFQLIRRS